MFIFRQLPSFENVTEKPKDGKSTLSDIESIGTEENRVSEIKETSKAASDPLECELSVNLIVKDIDYNFHKYEPSDETVTNKYLPNPSVSSPCSNLLEETLDESPPLWSNEEERKRPTGELPQTGTLSFGVSFRKPPDLDPGGWMWGSLWLWLPLLALLCSMPVLGQSMGEPEYRHCLNDGVFSG